MKQYNILILTDHSSHSKENSLYAIANQMIQHPQCGRLYIASRGNPNNNAFFDIPKQQEIHAYPVIGEIGYKKGNHPFDHQTECIHTDIFDIIFMRLPRPVTDNFLEVLESQHSDKVIINRPLGIKKTSNKVFLLRFQDICPIMKYCRSQEDIISFSKQFPIVLKPLEEYGGKGIVKIDQGIVNDGNQSISLEQFLDEKKTYIQNEGYLAMQFLKNVDQGDKRILVVNGQIMASSLRLPKEGSWICNVAQGGRSVSSSATEEEKAMIRIINPILLKEGIFMYGADTLVNDKGKRVLSEINTLSIGGFPQAEQQTGLPIIQMTINKFFEYANQGQP